MPACSLPQGGRGPSVGDMDEAVLFAFHRMLTKGRMIRAGRFKTLPDRQSRFWFKALGDKFINTIRIVEHCSDAQVAPHDDLLGHGDRVGSVEPAKGWGSTRKKPNCCAERARKCRSMLLKQEGGRKEKVLGDGSTLEAHSPGSTLVLGELVKRNDSGTQPCRLD